jgi:hypothetical protein
METSTAVPTVRTETKSILAKAKTGLRKGTLWSLIWFRAACRWFFLDTIGKGFFEENFESWWTGGSGSDRMLPFPGFIMLLMAPMWVPLLAVGYAFVAVGYAFVAMVKLPSYLISKLEDK